MMDETPGPGGQRGDGPAAGRWETLAQAYQDHGFPPENLPLIQKLVDAVGITHYEGIQSRGYIKAYRRDGRHWLHIHSGYTGGLLSESEVLEAVGDIDRSSWKDGKEWWITHPANRIGGGGGISNRAAGPPREPERCPIHNIELPASGICSWC